MDRVAFFDVDTQYDFMDPAGALYVPGAEGLWRRLKALTEYAESRRIPVIASADAHEPGDPEFLDFPPHCLRGSRGAARIPETRLAGALVAGPKDDPRRLLEATRGAPRVLLEKRAVDVFSNPLADRVVRAIDASSWVVYGVATEYCVRAAALGLRARGVDVAVVSDAVKGIAPDAEAAALAEMKRAGIWFIEAEVLIKALDRPTARPERAAARNPRMARR